MAGRLLGSEPHSSFPLLRAGIGGKNDMRIGAGLVSIDISIKPFVHPAAAVLFFERIGRCVECTVRGEVPCEPPCHNGPLFTEGFSLAQEEQ